MPETARETTSLLPDMQPRTQVGRLDFSQTPFGQLPAEIRNHICELALFQGRIEVECRVKDGIPLRLKSRHIKHPLALAHTCRTLYQDTLKMFYASNHFVFSPPGTYEALKRRTTAARHIREMTIVTIMGYERMGQEGDWLSHTVHWMLARRHLHIVLEFRLDLSWLKQEVKTKVIRLDSRTLYQDLKATLLRFDEQDKLDGEFRLRDLFAGVAILLLHDSVARLAT